MSEALKPSWHGIPRREIQWFPTVKPEACIGCGLCYVTCGRGVFDMEGRTAVAARPYECMVGCSTCATVCPVEAISFPGRDVIWKAEREHKIFRLVRQEAKEKRAKQDALAARARAEEAVAALTTRTRLEIAGEFGDKRFLARLQDLVKDRPFDIVNLQLHVPTVQGSMEKTPSFMVFEVTSTEQDDIQAFLPELRTLIRENDLVLVSEKKA
jgi:NAD-dependent dihydropyrimidine dehydrogenase PreA subunit